MLPHRIVNKQNDYAYVRLTTRLHPLHRLNCRKIQCSTHYVKTADTRNMLQAATQTMCYGHGYSHSNGYGNANSSDNVSARHSIQMKLAECLYVINMSLFHVCCVL